MHAKALTSICNFELGLFSIYAFCGPCGHNAAVVDPKKVGQEVEIQGFRECE